MKIALFTVMQFSEKTVVIWRLKNEISSKNHFKTICILTRMFRVYTIVFGSIEFVFGCAERGSREKGRCLESYPVQITYIDKVLASGDK